MQFKELTHEVLFTSDSITKINIQDINILKSKAIKNERKRIRLCVHPNIKDNVHEMLIVHSKGGYVRPHKHINKSESFHLIEGFLEVVIFDDSGNIKEIIHMGDHLSGEAFFYRLSESCFHTVVPISPIVVFHETTSGPFQRDDTLFPPWAPHDDEHEAQLLYLAKLIDQLRMTQENRYGSAIQASQGSP